MHLGVVEVLRLVQFRASGPRHDPGHCGSGAGLAHAAPAAGPARTGAVHGPDRALDSRALLRPGSAQLCVRLLRSGAANGVLLPRGPRQGRSAGHRGLGGGGPVPGAHALHDHLSLRGRRTRAPCAVLADAVAGADGRRIGLCAGLPRDLPARRHDQPICRRRAFLAQAASRAGSRESGGLPCRRQAPRSRPWRPDRGFGNRRLALGGKGERGALYASSLCRLVAGAPRRGDCIAPVRDRMRQRARARSVSMRVGIQADVPAALPHSICARPVHAARVASRGHAGLPPMGGRRSCRLVLHCGVDLGRNKHPSCRQGPLLGVGKRASGTQRRFGDTVLSRPGVPDTLSGRHSVECL